MRRTLLTLAALAAASLAASPAVAIDLAPHRAAYAMMLKSARPGSGVVSVTGAMILETSDACDGWTVSQRIRLRMTVAEAGEFETDTTFSSWESKDGLNYRFSTRTLRDGDVSEEIRGHASLSGRGGAGIAHFTKPETDDLQLPPGTVFPTEHMVMLLNEAIKGGNSLTATLFDGASEDGTFQVSGLIGPQLPPSAEAAASALLKRPGWRMRLAFFPIASQDSQPSYEVTATLRDNGVAAPLEFDYGEFSVDAKLDRIEVLPKC
jgi:EipB-like